MTTEPTGQTVMIPEAAQPPAASESGAFLNMIERLATDPRVDVDKLERLMLLQERILARNAKSAYNAALAEMQQKLPTITERGEIRIHDKVQSKFARFEDIVEAITPILGAHGFALSFRIGRDTDRQTVTGILSHREGHQEETTISLPVDASGSKNSVQSVGSSMSYGRRYVTQALLNLVSSGEDDDGEGGNDGLISADQKLELVALMQETGADTGKYLKYLNVESLDQIKAANFGRAKSALEAKRAKAS